jgi:MSHA biogenesis protein MshJ
MSQWLTYSEKFNNTTPREQYLIIASGLVAVIFVLYSLFLDEPIQNIGSYKEQTIKAQQDIESKKGSIQVLKQALSEDPNTALKRELSQYQAKLGDVDKKLLELTSDLIDPIQMRFALIKLLKLQKGVKLLSFEVLPANPVTEDKVIADDENETEQTIEKNNTSTVKTRDVQSQPAQLRLYRHGIKIKLQGQYFELKDYLTQLESLSWKFFWQEFDYQLKAYPVSELEIEIYSLSTSQEFIGV